MARENQGLQIALIIFVMLTIVLGVTTYLFFRQSQEADLKLAANNKQLQTATTLATTNENDVRELKRQIYGTPNTEKIDAAIASFGDDMKKYAAGYPEDVRFYRPLLEKMAKEISDTSATLVQTQDKLKLLEADFAMREANKKPQIDAFQKAADDAKKDLDSQTDKLTSDRNRITAQEAEVKKNLEDARKEATVALEKVEKKLKDAMTEYDALRGVNRTLRNKVEKLTSQKFEVPQGEILWVNQRAGTVWIDLGQADTLQRQITFSVYPAGVTDPTTGDKKAKASIEVTKVLGDHLAEARALDDRPIDPIMVGDKIYTPLWTPGEKRHFAVAGFIDFDGSERSSLTALIDLINMNGGVVDSYVDDKGKLHGNITVNTRYLILGNAPGDKGLPAMREAFTKALSDADRFGVQKIQLNDVLQRMGWRNRASIVEFGRGANARDFSIKPETGGSTKLSPNAGDAFQPRHPPGQTATSPD